MVEKVGNGTALLREAWPDRRTLAWASHERGELVLAGALAEPADGAVLVFQGDSPAAAEAFAEADPYVRHGLVTGWRVRPWTTVVGDRAATPVRPSTTQP